jgi:hypothetical protein
VGWEFRQEEAEGTEGNVGSRSRESTGETECFDGGPLGSGSAA